MTVPTGSIAVGVDASKSSENALAWALDEADRVGAPVHVIHVLHDPAFGHAIDTVFRDALVEYAEKSLAKADRLRQGRQTPYSAEWVAGSPAEVLVASSKHARMVVVGSRGHSGFTAAVLGSVGQSVIRHAHCPVAVVRDLPEKAMSVVVGVDTAVPEPALGRAFEAASAMKLPLTVVHAWQLPPIAGPGLGVPIAGSDVDVIESGHGNAITDIVEKWSSKFPAVPFEIKVIRDHPAHALIEASASSALTVVGSRGHGGFTGLMLGSTSATVAAHAHSPVLVAR